MRKYSHSFTLRETLKIHLEPPSCAPHPKQPEEPLSADEQRPATAMNQGAPQASIASKTRSKQPKIRFGTP